MNLRSTAGYIGGIEYINILLIYTEYICLYTGNLMIYVEFTFLKKMIRFLITLDIDHKKNCEDSILREFHISHIIVSNFINTS